MLKQTYVGTEDFESVRREFLRPEEFFLLKFLNSFDRRTTQEWKDMGLWDSY